MLFIYLKIEKKDEVVVINSSQVDEVELDASHVSVITVGEEPSVKELNSWKSKEEIEVSKPICVPVNTVSESNKLKMNGRATVVKPHDPTEVYIVVNNSINVHKLVIYLKLEFLMFNIILKLLIFKVHNIHEYKFFFSQKIHLMELL